MVHIVTLVLLLPVQLVRKMVPLFQLPLKQLIMQFLELIPVEHVLQAVSLVLLELFVPLVLIPIILQLLKVVLHVEPHVLSVSLVLMQVIMNMLIVLLVILDMS